MDFSSFGQSHSSFLLWKEWIWTIAEETILRHRNEGNGNGLNWQNTFLTLRQCVVGKRLDIKSPSFRGKMRDGKGRFLRITILAWNAGGSLESGGEAAA